MTSLTVQLQQLRLIHPEVVTMVGPVIAEISKKKTPGTPWFHSSTGDTMKGIIQIPMKTVDEVVRTTDSFFQG